MHGDEFGIVETTKSITSQLGMVDNPDLSEIWLTHAHLGHIEGLGQLGKEALNSKNIKLRCSESVVDYVMKHPIWKKLIVRGNITFAKYFSEEIIPIKVPHRAQDFDTHALLFRGQNNNILFLPDHGTWEETLESVDYDNPKDWFISLGVSVVLLDGTFWNSDELKSRVQSQVPHPTVSETIDLLGSRNEGDPRIIFIHLNHTNPLNYPDSKQYKKVEKMGWEIGCEGMEFNL